MKRQMMFSLLTFGILHQATAAMNYAYTGAAYAIPDGNSSGVSSSISVSGAGSYLSSISVNLDVSGGYNGDLYAYLTYNGVLVTLLNRIGVGTTGGGTASGNSGAGFNIFLGSSGTDVHLATSGFLTGSSYQADGRNVDPNSTAASFNAAGTQSLNDFSGQNPNGTWTLFFADVSGGGGTSELNGWSLDMEVVPEPVNAALGIVGALFCLGTFFWRFGTEIKNYLNKFILLATGVETAKKRSR